MSSEDASAPAGAELERYVDEMARRLGVRIDAMDVPAVVSVFSVLERNAAALMAFALPESIEAAPVFRIPPELDE